MMMDDNDFAINVGRDAQDVFFDKLRTFVIQQETEMQVMEEAFSDGWDLTTWDAHTDTVTLELGSHNIRRTLADTLGRTKLHNRLFFRLTMVMTSVMEEMKALTEECYTQLLGPLAMYGDPQVDSDGIADEEAQQGLGRIVPFLMDVWNWARRVEKTVLYVMRQFGALYDARHMRDKYHPYQSVHFPVVWQCLIDLLGAVVAIEEVLVSHDVIRQGLSVYRRMLATAAKNTEKYDADEFEIQQFGKLLNKLEHDLLSDGLFLKLCSMLFDCPEASVAANDSLYKEFAGVLNELGSNIDNSLNTPREGEGRKKVIGLCGLFVLFNTLYTHKLMKEQGDLKRLGKLVFDYHKKVPVVHIHAANVFKPAQWLARRVPTVCSLFVKDPVSEGMTAIKAECARVAQLASPTMNHLTTCVTIWCAQMASSYPTAAGRGRHMIQSLTAFIQRGLIFASETHRLLRTLIFLHQSADLSLTLPMVDIVRQGVVLLMMIRGQFHSRTGRMASLFDLLCAQQCYVMEKQLFQLHMKVNDSLQTASESVTDQHTALGQALALLAKPHTPQSIALLDVVLNIAFSRKDCCFDVKEFEETLQAFGILKRLVHMQASVQQNTNCEFLYWQREAFYPIFFQRLYNNAGGSESLPYLLEAMHDCCGTLLSAKHVEEPKELFDDYAKFVRRCMKTEMFEKMFSAIETDLRLHTHAAVLGQPFRSADPDARDLARFTRLPPMRLFGERLHIAAIVEDYLDAQFYNLNALHPNDWKTYEEMRTLAHDRYSLTLLEGFLPGSIVDQGLDVLVITKNIHVFVANYTYNMNEQVFVQRPSVTESKHLHTLAVRHVTNSIRTHGAGIMNTTVNYVFRYLVKKLAILSQFLYDDHVKSRLLKDMKFFNQNKEALDRTYPIARADKYCAEIKKLGVTEDGKTYLDQVRLLVGEIGNALGYMRMVRSGGLRAVANAAVFIPEMESLPHLERCIDPKARREDEGIDEDELDILPSDEEEEDDIPPPVALSTTGAVRIVDNVVYGMKKRLSQGSDYFKVLQDAIAKKIKDPEKYGHLKNFFMIVAPMSISYVEHMVNQKELLLKKNKEGLFTDDGFALGCVFLLSLFRVHDEFDSLHWFEGVTKHYVARKKEMDDGIAARKAKAKNSGKKDKKENYADPSGQFALGEGEINSMQLTLTMVESNLREYSTLAATFGSSRVFFQYRTEEEQEVEEEEEEEDDE